MIKKQLLRDEGNRGGGANGGAGGSPFQAWLPGIGYFQPGGGGGGLTHSLLPAISAGNSGGKGGNGWGAGGSVGRGAPGVVLVMWGSSINESFSY